MKDIREIHPSVQSMAREVREHNSSKWRRPIMWAIWSVGLGTLVVTGLMQTAVAATFAAMTVYTLSAVVGHLVGKLFRVNIPFWHQNHDWKHIGGHFKAFLIEAAAVAILLSVSGGWGTFFTIVGLGVVVVSQLWMLVLVKWGEKIIESADEDARTKELTEAFAADPNALTRRAS